MGLFGEKLTEEEKELKKKQRKEKREQIKAKIKEEWEIAKAESKEEDRINKEKEDNSIKLQDVKKNDYFFNQKIKEFKKTRAFSSSKWYKASDIRSFELRTEQLMKHKNKLITVVHLKANTKVIEHYTIIIFLKDEKTPTMEIPCEADYNTAKSIMMELEEMTDTGNTKQENNKNNSLEEIKQLKELLDIGAITEDEFNQKKKELLNL